MLLARSTLCPSLCYAIVSTRSLKCSAIVDYPISQTGRFNAGIADRDVQKLGQTNVEVAKYRGIARDTVKNGLAQTQDMLWQANCIGKDESEYTF